MTPSTWSLRRLADCGQFLSGGTPSRSKSSYWNGSIPWISAKSLKSSPVVASEDRLTEEGIKNGTTVVQPGTLLFVVRGMSLAKEFRVGVTGRTVAFNQDVRALVPNADVDACYLMHFLKSRERAILDQVDHASHGTTRLTSDRIEAIQVPLPPRAEQRRITAALDRAEALRAKRRAALALLDTLTQSIFLDLFGASEDAAHRWGEEPLGELVEDFRYGTSNKSGSVGSPALRIPNVVGGGLNLAEIKLVPVDGAELRRLLLGEGDVLFVRTNGNPDFVGRCAVFERSVVAAGGFDPDEFIFASYLIRARLLPKIAPIFLREFLLSSKGRRDLRARCKTSAGQFNINIEGLSSIQVPVPPASVQQRFVQRVAAVEKLKAAHRASLARLDELFASLQHRAFRGEL